MNSTKAKLKQTITTEASSSNDESQLQDRVTGDMIPTLSSLNPSKAKGDGDQDAKSQASPLTEFTQFGKFPKELRLKIWRVLLLQPRIIEIEAKHEPVPGSFPGQFSQNRPRHDNYMVSRHSREPPVTLHICHESREEALNAYKLMPIFATSRHRIYFNPLMDIAYFGQNSCIATMKDLFQEKWEIYRMAVDLGMQMKDCHPRRYKSSISVMQALHGLKWEACEGFRFPPCSGVKDIFFIASTINITDTLTPQDSDWEWDEEQSSIVLNGTPSVIYNVDCVGLCSVPDDKIEESEQAIKAEYQAEIGRVKDGHGLTINNVLGESRGHENWWTGDKIPNFHFVELSQREAWFNPLSRRRRREAQNATTICKQQPSMGSMKVAKNLDQPWFDPDWAPSEDLSGNWAPVQDHEWLTPEDFEDGHASDSDSSHTDGPGGLYRGFGQSGPSVNSFYDIWDGYDNSL
jgi:hypothetical protein